MIMNDNGDYDADDNNADYNNDDDDDGIFKLKLW